MRIRDCGRGSVLRRRLPAVVLVLCAVIAPAPAQRENAVSATLPESNEALLLASKIQDALHAGDYRLAIELIDQLRNQPTGLVAAPASRTFYPVWQQAARLLDQLPAEGVQLYRQLYDAEVQTRFEQAAAVCDTTRLHELFRGYPLSGVWPRIREELASLLLDRGAAGAALDVLHELPVDVGEESPECRALQLVALARIGAKRQAEKRLAELRADPAISGQETWRQKLERIEHWLATEVQDAGSGGDDTRAFLPRLELGNAWAGVVPAKAGSVCEHDSQDLAEAAEVLRRLPLQNGLIAAGSRLIVRQQGMIIAYDADTLQGLWQARENETPAPSVRGAYFLPSNNRPQTTLSQRDRTLLDDHLRHVLSAGFGKLYTVESLSPAFSDADDLSLVPFQSVQGTQRWNELVARELDSGRVAWSTHADPAHPLFEAIFQNAPLATEHDLLAPFVRGDELLLAALDPDTGELLREISIVGPPAEYPAVGGRCLLIQDVATIFVCTGNGVIAALSRDDLSWKWAATYPSTLAQRLGRLWWQPLEDRSDLNVDPPLLVDDLLIAAPVDSEEIIALNRYDGTEVWRMPRRDYPYLVGVMRIPARGAPDAVAQGSVNHLILGGHTVGCYPVESPAPDQPRWRSAPLHVTGRIVCREPCVYVPTSAGVLVLDGASGKIINDPDSSTGVAVGPNAAQTGGKTNAPGVERLLKDNEPAQNLLVGPTALYGVAPDRVVKYPDPERLRERFQVLSDANADELKRAFLGAWVNALDRDYAAALARLDAFAAQTGTSDPLRDRLVTYLFLCLAGQTTGGNEQLGWLQHARGLAAAPEAAARMAAIIGAVLEKQERWQAALDHYLELVASDNNAGLVDPSDARRNCAAWLYAARRAAIVARLGTIDVWSRLLAAGVEPATADTRTLQRLGMALGETPQSEWIDVLLCLGKLAPELKELYFRKEVPAFLPLAFRRWYLLERWDTHVSLDQLQQGTKDEHDYADALTQADVASMPAWLEALTPPGAVELEDRAAAIALAERKLRQFEERPYAPPVTRQWKIEHAELLQDQRQPMANVRPWILVADLEPRRIDLVNAYKHQQPQRQTPDQLDEGVGDWRAVAAASAPRRFDTDTAPRPAWPVALYEDLAAMPVPGGLIGLGLGPERYAGRRLWSRAVPEWSGIPTDFAAHALAGPEGVYYTPRSDRIILANWLDGGLLWQRDFPGVKIERLERIENNLVVISEDRGVWLLDAVFGDELRQIGTEETPIRVDVTGDTLVFWGRESIVAFSGRDAGKLWERQTEAVKDTYRLPEGPWIAYRTESAPVWRLLDARTGRDAFEEPLGRFDALLAAYVEGKRVYAAGISVNPHEPTELRHLTLRALALDDGAEVWQHEFDTNARVNATQLAAHPEYIPFLLTGIGGSRIDGVEFPLLQWVDKTDGKLCEPQSIRADYRSMVDASCEMYLLATPTRIIVQIGGNVLAYGNSPLRQGP